jgi:hypothetical protein
VKAFFIRISCPGCAPIEFEGLFRSHWEAFDAALDQAPSPLCGITTRRLSA